MNNQETPVKTKKLKWIYVLLIIFVLALAGLAYYWFVYKNNKSSQSSDQGSSDETADWSTYQNATYGYSLKYPKDWLIEEEDAADVKFFLRTSQDATLGTGAQVLVEIKSSADDGSKKPSDWAKSELKDKKFSLSETLVGGKEAILANVKEGDVQTQEAFLIVDKTRYHFDQIEADKTIFEDFNLMVKSFKLIAKETVTTKSTETTGVLTQTYTDEKYGFSLKYPKDWLEETPENTDSHTLLEVNFTKENIDKNLFTLKVSDRTLENEITLYKANLGQSTDISEIDASLGEYQGKKITSSKGSIENAAIFLKRDKILYVIIGEVKDPDATYKLYFDQMTASITFTKLS